MKPDTAPTKKYRLRPTPAPQHCSPRLEHEAPIAGVGHVMPEAEVLVTNYRSPVQCCGAVNFGPAPAPAS